MKIILTIETTNRDEFGEPRRKVTNKEVTTLNAALSLLWKLKKPRLATLKFVPEDVHDREKLTMLTGRQGSLFSKRNQRKGICVILVDSREDTSELPALHERTDATWRQLPTRFNKLMKELDVKLDNEKQDGETGNAYDDLAALVPKKKTTKKKAKGKAKKKTAKKKIPTIPTVPPDILAIPPIPAEEDEDIFDWFDEDTIDEEY
jgi:hypothetical protein